MSKLRPLGNNLGLQKSFGSEDGVHYRHYKQDFGPAMEHRKYLDEKVNGAPKSGNKNGWRHHGVVPTALVLDWLSKNGYTIDQWARNDGGRPDANPDNYHKDPGIKSQFMRYFFTREFSKLHNHHITTKRESTSHAVPAGFKKSGELIVPSGV